MDQHKIDSGGDGCMDQRKSSLSSQSFIHSFIPTAPLQVHYYSEALPTQHGYCPYAAARAGFEPATL